MQLNHIRSITVGIYAKNLLQLETLSVENLFEGPSFTRDVTFDSENLEQSVSTLRLFSNSTWN